MYCIQLDIFSRSAGFFCLRVHLLYFGGKPALFWLKLCNHCILLLPDCATLPQSPKVNSTSACPAHRKAFMLGHPQWVNEL
uniref:Uncharacterized protein n=1 Tax=Anguilla anguilla TaxID=7936 RepID=A0A0E9WLJ7_ANGAN